MISHFQVIPSTNLPSHICPSSFPLSDSSPSPTHTSLPHCSGIPLLMGIKSPWDKGKLLPLLSGKAILCYIFIWSHGSLHVHSLAGDVDFERTGWSSHPILFFQWGCNAPLLHSSNPCASCPTRFPEFSLMVGSKHLHLHWSVAVQTFPGSATLGSLPLDHNNSVGFGVCTHDVSPGGTDPWLTLPSVSAPFSVPILLLDRNISGLKEI